MGAQKVLLPIGGGTVADAGKGAGADEGAGPDRGTTAGRTVIERIARELARSAIDRILVVVGHEAERVEEALRMSVGREVTLVRNPDPDGDMLSSVRCGLRALPGGCEAVLVALGDQPRISAETIDALIDAYGAHRKGIVVPAHRGKRGHPVLFAASYSTEILERYDGTGLRGLLAAHPEDVLELEVPDPSVLCDMDSPEDYRREREASEG